MEDLSMKRITCVLAAVAILVCSTNGLAQARPAAPRPDDKLRGQVAEALKKSKPIVVKVTNPNDLSGAKMKGDEVKGVVKSLNSTCFLFEYKDGLKNVRADCIPYGDVVIEEWHMRALEKLRTVGLYSAYITGGLALMPIVIPAVLILALLGHRFDC